MQPREELEELERRGLRRGLVPFTGLDFASNDFLGLARSPAVREEMLRYLGSGGALGSTGSRLVSGESALVSDTEELVARMHGVPAALFFGSGYLANIGATAALAAPGCEFFSDELNHASLIDGMRLTREKVCRFRHNDLGQLAGQLAASAAPRKIVVTESVFSQDGDGPDLAELKKIVEGAGAFLILDEAHATGVCGPSGLGRAEGIAFAPEHTLLVHTCGKALGGYGAFVLGGQTLRALLIQKARTFLFSTAPPPLQIVQARAALVEAQKAGHLRSRLAVNAEALACLLREAGVQAPARHIMAVPVPGNERALRAAEAFQRAGIFVRAMRAPTVPAGSERLRVTVKAFHGAEDYARFARILREVLPA